MKIENCNISMNSTKAEELRYEAIIEVARALQTLSNTLDASFIGNKYGIYFEDGSIVDKPDDKGDEYE